MSIGYACMTLAVQDAEYRTCIMKNADRSRLLCLIEHNLNVLDRMIEYNNINGIKLFRICSELIPFGSSPINNLEWEKIFKDKFHEIGSKIKKYGIRVSMHPGQYTVLNSPKPEVVKAAIADLDYHYRVLKLLDTNKSNKIILHIGGIYGDKKSAMNRFINEFNKLDIEIKERIAIENDDKYYTIEDALEIGNQCSIPVIFDALHFEVLPSQGELNYWIDLCAKTFKSDDGRQKIHYSEQGKGRFGAHSESINSEQFLIFYNSLINKDIDIMLEVKDKNLSALKCINLIARDNDITRLEKEWARYKYKVLETSREAYDNIRELLKDKNSYPVNEFYLTIEEALRKEITIGNAVNAAMHVWGYFKSIADIKEKEYFIRNIDKYQSGRISLRSVKNQLYRLSVKYNETYLLNSYYFLSLNGR